MDIKVYDSNVKEIAIIDNYISLVWTDRYIECGDFTLDLEATTKNLNTFSIGNYLRIRYSQHTMLIETISLKHNDDGTSMLTVSGRSVECILERRSYIPVRIEGTTLPTAFKEMSNILKLCVAPGAGDLTTYYFDADPYATYEVGDIPNDGKSYGTFSDITDCYSEVMDLCSRKHVGFRFKFYENSQKDSNGNTPYFRYIFYKGKDRSASGNSNEPLILSHRYDTLISSEFVKSNRNLITHVQAYKVLNYTSTSGQSKTEQLTYLYHVPGTATRGPNRRDALLDMSGKADKDKDGNDIPYILNGILASDANELFAPYAEAEIKKQLAKNSITELYSGEIEPKASGIQYMKDYYLGDIVDFENVYNAYSKSRITEVIISSDDTGDTIYPTFSSLADEVDE